MLIHLNHPYKCRYCKKPYVILQGFNSWSFLPVNIVTGEEINDEEFDSKKHHSHLLDCPHLQAQWEDVKKMINKQMGSKFFN